MGFLDYFKRSSKSASVAKDRLQIVIARERTATRPAAVDYLPQLQQELLQVIAKYELIDLGQVTVNVDKQGGCEVLELNVVLAPAKSKPAADPPIKPVPATATS